MTRILCSKLDNQREALLKSLVELKISIQASALFKFGIAFIDKYNMWYSVQEVPKIRGEKNLRIGMGKNTMLGGIKEVQAVKGAE